MFADVFAGLMISRRFAKMMFPTIAFVILLSACASEIQSTATETLTPTTKPVTQLIEPTLTLPSTNTVAPVIPSAAPPTIEPTSTEVSKRKTLIAIPIQASNCRSSCSTTQSAISDTLTEGIEYVATGQDSTGMWLQFVGPHSAESCWVLNSSINLWWGEIILEQAAVPKDLLPVTACSGD